MRKPKRYDKNYTAAENREIRILKGQGWTNNEIAQHMGRTEIGISRHWSNINKTEPVQGRTTFTGRDKSLIFNTMRSVCEDKGFRAPFVRVYDDRHIERKRGIGFKVMNGSDYPEWIWDTCVDVVKGMGYNCQLSDDYNYAEDRPAHSRGIRVIV